jgi:hypothetical protein
MSFRQTSLWQNAQTGVSISHQDHLDRLRSELLKSRGRAAVLTERIAASFPNLTVHDVSHLDALWEIAALIAGPEYILNPLEVFVFGAAILFHDAALCFEAYDGGQAAVRSTTAWKDAFTLEQTRNPKHSVADCTSVADFIAVRNLHGKQAAELALRKWNDPATGDPLYLIEDTHIRKHLGTLVGEIAASHHWSIEQVRAKLPRQFNAPAEFPTEWSIEPQKLACLLRCADALHIDSRRAPDFFHALLRRTGVSFEHWQAQNQIGRISLDKTDLSGNTVLLSTTQPFSEENAASWWVIYDAACVAQREIESSNALLVAEGIGSFRVKRIRGIESPELMSDYVRADGWSPCSAAIHISNIENLVRSLGGAQLYGTSSDLFAIAIRELVQNARDAIRARAKIVPGFVGEIKVRISHSTPLTVEVRDNGIGMSKRVMTGPLLDFGTSFWASSLVQAEYPGLSSSGFAAVGKFGIGFYSVFMVSDQVTVVSRRWDEGLKDAHQLIFTGGVALRPLLKSGAISGFGADDSTLVRLTVADEVIPADRMVTIKSGIAHMADVRVPLADYLAVYFAGLDVDVTIDVGEAATVRHARQPLKVIDRLDWLHRLAFTKYREPTAAHNLNTAVGNRLRPIFENDRCVGLAAISALPQPRVPFASVPTVGGLAVTAQGGRANFYIGFLDHSALSAKRDQGERTASSETVRQWAQEQLELLKQADLNPIQRAAVAYALAEFDIDPTEIAMFAIRTGPGCEFLTADQVVDRLHGRRLLFWKSSLHDHIDNYVGSGYKDYDVFVSIDNGKFNALKMENGIPAVRNSAIGCLHAAMDKRGIRPHWVLRENIAASILGPVHGLILTIENHRYQT